MSTSPTADPGGPRPMGRLAPLFAGIWLFFLLDPLLEGWSRRDEPRGVVGMVATLAFASLYLGVWLHGRADRGRPGAFSLRAALAYVIALIALGLTMLACLGETGLAFVVYVGVACVVVFSIRVAAPLVVALVVGVIALSAVEDWGSQVGTAFGLMAASVAVYGLRAVMLRNVELLHAHAENAALAVENERTRFARDLHDILGHSLTVITVKAELAQKLMSVDLERARAEVSDLERLSRDALADVRRAVAGYRDLTLPGELARARTALAAAQIDADVPQATDEVPSDLRDLFAWTIREGVTNVIRHSHAGRCQVLLSADRAEVRDDGVGAGVGVGAVGAGTGPGADSRSDSRSDSAADGGAGLIGLRERAAALGATVVTSALEPGFCLAVVRQP